MAMQQFVCVTGDLRRMARYNHVGSAFLDYVTQRHERGILLFDDLSISTSRYWKGDFSQTMLYDAGFLREQVADTESFIEATDPTRLGCVGVINLERVLRKTSTWSELLTELSSNIPDMIETKNGIRLARGEVLFAPPLDREAKVNYEAYGGIIERLTR